MTPTFAGPLYVPVCTVCSREFPPLYGDDMGVGCSAHTEKHNGGFRLICAGYGSVFDMDNFLIVGDDIPATVIVCDLCLIAWLRSGDIVYWRSNSDAEPDSHAVAYYALGVAIGKWSW